MICPCGCSGLVKPGRQYAGRGHQMRYLARIRPRSDDWKRGYQAGWVASERWFQTATFRGRKGRQTTQQ